MDSPRGVILCDRIRDHAPLLLAIVILLGAVTAQAQSAPAPSRVEGPDGAAVFQKACASCHANPGPDSRAPTREVLRTVAPEAILTALTVGNMFRQGSEIADAERRAVAAFLAGRPVGTAPPASIVGRCQAQSAPLQASALSSGWNGWGADAANTRFQPAARAGLNAASVPRLKLKWAYGFAGVNSARSQPAVLGGRVFVASDNGDVVALDAKRGCQYWSYHAQAGIRTAVSVGPYKTATTNGFAVYFSDGAAIAYAIDANTGREIWRRKLDDHTYARATGSLTVYQGRVYVPIAGVGEEGQGGIARYECCTFRGSVSALDASTGAVIWKSTRSLKSRNRDIRTRQGFRRGDPQAAASGALRRSIPRVVSCTLRRVITTPHRRPTRLTRSSRWTWTPGKHRWVYQPTPNDVWAGGCRPENPADSNCPEKLGPDHDFSIAPLLTKAPNGREVVIVQQKSGHGVRRGSRQGHARVAIQDERRQRDGRTVGDRRRR